MSTENFVSLGPIRNGDSIYLSSSLDSRYNINGTVRVANNTELIENGRPNNFRFVIISNRNNNLIKSGDTVYLRSTDNNQYMGIDNSHTRLVLTDTQTPWTITSKGNTNVITDRSVISLTLTKRNHHTRENILYYPTLIGGDDLPVSVCSCGVDNYCRTDRMITLIINKFVHRPIISKDIPKQTTTNSYAWLFWLLLFLLLVAIVWYIYNKKNIGSCCTR